MNPRIRIAAFAGLMLLATAGLARAAATSYPAAVEQALEAPTPGGRYIDYSNCPTPQEQHKVQIQAMLQFPSEERGRAIEKGSCAVGTEETAPNQVDDRYAIGH